MRQSPKNLFDTGGHDQYLLLVPYLNAVLDYTPKTSASGCDEFYFLLYFDFGVILLVLVRSMSIFQIGYLT